MAKLKVWFFETRPQFLVLEIALVFLGTSIAWYYGFFNAGYALLAVVGQLLANASVNVLNDYFDYKSGIDLETEPTPFSGGSGVLRAGLLRPKQVMWFGIVLFLLAVPIGVFFLIVRGWWLLPILVVGAATILFYTTHIVKTPWPEWAPALRAGSLPVLGAFFIQSGAYTVPAIIAAIPSGILVHNLLFLNEFPDAEADKKAGRKTLPIIIGKAKASRLYAATTVMMYLWIIGGVVARVMPLFSLVALLTVPFAIKAVRGAYDFNNRAKFVPAQANNIIVVLLTQFLLGIGYILARVFG